MGTIKSMTYKEAKKALKAVGYEKFKVENMGDGDEVVTVYIRKHDVGYFWVYNGEVSCKVVKHWISKSARYANKNHWSQSQ